MTRLLVLFLAAIGGVVQALLKSQPLGARLGSWLFSVKVLAVLIPAGFLAAFIYLWVAFHGPRMKFQPHIRSFEASMPLIPDNTVALEETSLWPVTNTSLSNISKDSLIEHGKTYYEYYCYFCHGNPGNGVGPVGHSFVPTPQDLSTIGAQMMSDSALNSIMVQGASHNPLIPYVVSAGQRSAISTFIRNGFR